MPGYLAGTPGITSRQSRHLAAWLSGHELIIALVIAGIMVAFIILLALPVLSSMAFDSFSSGFNRAARGTFLFGFGILIVGLASGVRIIDILGGAVMAAVIVGIIVENYLARPSRSLLPDSARRQGTVPRGTTHCMRWPVTSAMKS